MVKTAYAAGPDTTSIGPHLATGNDGDENFRNSLVATFANAMSSNVAMPSCAESVCWPMSATGAIVSPSYAVTVYCHHCFFRSNASTAELLRSNAILTELLRSNAILVGGNSTRLYFRVPE